MEILKCKMCGGDIQVEENQGFGTCEYCGTTMTLPKIDSEQQANQFNRGNHFRRNGEFDRAYQVYERIIEQDPTNAEAHWCLALSRYGIEYVEDPTSHERIPTFHRMSYDLIMNDADYQAALQYSEGITRSLYEKEGNRIAEIQKGMLAISQQEDPYDVFICYKETDEKGERTQDSVIAQDIYYQLVNEGYKVFFSRITLEGKLGQKYEPYIFAALNSAKTMLVVGTKPEYYNAVWVKNEWGRYLQLMKKDKNRLLIPCYRDMDPYDLPEELSYFQSQNMGKIGFIQDLIHGIKKILSDKQEPVQATVQQAVSVQNTVNDQLRNIVALGFMDLEQGKNESAEQTFRDALKMDMKCAEAYLGLYIVTHSKGHKNLQGELNSYASKMKRYAPQMTEFEKELFQDEMQLKIVQSYLYMKDNDRIKTILQIQPDILESRIYEPTAHYPLLTWAILEKDMEMVAVLLENGANPNGERICTTDYAEVHISPLGDAIWNEPNVEIVRLLLQYGADANGYRVYQKDNEYAVYSLLSDAIWNAHNIEMVQLLLQHGANPNFMYQSHNEDGTVDEYTMLSDAIIYAQNMDMVQLLLQYGASLDTEITVERRKKPIRKFPFRRLMKTTISPDFLRQLKTIGWKEGWF
ncbi:TIR domain-containing protein [Massilioclostridium coli]|uniref:TIR domain-containing protein n=1 Tax=Massilioclostridium coli TaxID=1870991 RepID=UPI0022E6C713|nr:TIR domain-containing protein [Massilioclostridium coli]